MVTRDYSDKLTVKFDTSKLNLVYLSMFKKLHL
jgi:hypothetical protein